MIKFSVDGIQRHIVQHVVHPPHIPLIVKAQATAKVGFAHHGPCHRLFCKSSSPQEKGQNGFIEFLQERNCLQVFPAAILIGQPLPVFPAIVQVEHRGHGIHPDAIDMVGFQPKTALEIKKLITSLRP